MVLQEPGGDARETVSEILGPSARAFYAPAGGGFMPGRLVTGPWDKRLQNGMALAGLAAYLVEGARSAVAMTTTRLVIDLQRPTPMALVTPHVRILREGKRLQIVQADILHEGALMVRATAMRVRDGHSPASEESPPHRLPDGLPSMNPRSPLLPVLETRLEQGGLEHLGPGIVWSRFHGEIVPGVPISPFVQLAMAADFGSGSSAYVDWREWTFVNVDITLHLLRMPRGPWARVQAKTRSAGNGIAVVETVLSDLEGMVGHAHQTLFVDRSKRPR